MGPRAASCGATSYCPTRLRRVHLPAMPVAADNAAATSQAAASTEVEQLEWQITELQQKLVAARKRQAGEVVKDYTFATPAGEVSLSQLFGSRRDLLVVHNMGRHCPYCTLWAD